MTNPIIRVHNQETGEVIDREMTAEELAEYEADKTASQAKAEAETAKAATRAAILDRLGLTQEEAALLLGAN